jgi:hypothetical protein
MKLIVLVVRHELHPDEHWVEAAWDQWTLDAGADGYFDRVNEAVQKYGHANVGELEIEVPDDTMGKAFPPVPVVQGVVVKGGKPEGVE